MKLLSCSGISRESVSDPSYYWNSAHRGDFPYVILQYTHSGCGFVRYEGVEYSVPSHSAFICIVPEESEYYYKPGSTEPWTFSWLSIFGDGALGLWSEIRSDFGCVLSFRKNPSILASMRALASASKSEELKDPFLRSAETYRFTMQVASALRPKESSKPTVGQVVEWIRTHPEQPLVVKEMAEWTGVSREHFTRLFMDEVGVSPAKFRNELQLEQAAVLLKQSTRSINDIAQVCGFSSPSRFSHRFRRQFGCSPRWFRNHEGSLSG